MTKPKDDTVERVANRLAAAIQATRDEIGANQAQNMAFAYAEAAMRSELPAALSNKDDEVTEAMIEAGRPLIYIFCRHYPK